MRLRSPRPRNWTIPVTRPGRVLLHFIIGLIIGSFIALLCFCIPSLIIGPILKSKKLIEGDVALPNFRDLQFRSSVPIDDENKIIVRSNGTVTYTGKDIAYQMWKLGLLRDPDGTVHDFGYRELAQMSRDDREGEERRGERRPRYIELSSPLGPNSAGTGTPSIPRTVGSVSRAVR